ncbi:hypothetical protein GCM10009689_14060 [Brevibacterium antiquum]
MRWNNLGAGPRRPEPNEQILDSVEQILDIVDQTVGLGPDDDLHGTALDDDPKGSRTLEGTLVDEILVADIHAQPRDARFDLIDIVRAAEAGHDLLCFAHTNCLRLPHSRTGAGVVFCDVRHKSTATHGQCWKRTLRRRATAGGGAPPPGASPLGGIR